MVFSCLLTAFDCDSRIMRLSLCLPADAGVALSDYKFPECHGHRREDAGVSARQYGRLHHHRPSGQGCRAGRKISFRLCCMATFYCFKLVIRSIRNLIVRVCDKNRFKWIETASRKFVYSVLSVLIRAHGLVDVPPLGGSQDLLTSFPQELPCCLYLHAVGSAFRYSFGIFEISLFHHYLFQLFNI